MVVSCLLPARFVVRHEPIDTLLDALLHGDELVVRTVLAEFLVAGRLLELPIGLGGVKDDFSLEFHGLGNCLGNIPNADFCRLIDRQSDGVRRVVLPHDPHSELGQVERVDELPQRRTGAPDSMFLGT